MGPGRCGPCEGWFHSATGVERSSGELEVGGRMKSIIAVEGVSGFRLHSAHGVEQGVGRDPRRRRLPGDGAVWSSSRIRPVDIGRGRMSGFP